MNALIEARTAIATRRNNWEQRARSSMERRRNQSVDVGGAIAGSRANQMLSVAGRDQQRMTDAYRAFRQWTYVCAHWVARRIGGQPWFAGELENAPDNPSDRARLSSGIKMRQPWLSPPPFMRSKAISQEQLNVLPAHPILDVLDHPNPLQRRFEFLYLSAINMQITGVCYWVGGMVKDKEAEGGQRMEIWALPSNYIMPDHSNGLFSSYRLKIPGEQGQGTDLPPECVARTYYADPTDLTAVYPPIAACWGAIKTDEFLQRNQEQSFERANTPRIALVVGKDDATGRRPTLNGPQRRQVTRAIMEVWDQTTRFNMPAILDGLIEEVIQLDRANREMDWINSGKITKDRIFQTFSVHPFVVGDPQNVTKAQAIVAEEVTCNNAVNPLMDSFSETATTWLGPMYEQPKRLILWIDPAKPEDEEGKANKWNQAKANNVVSADEYRAEILKLPPIEPEEPEPVLRTNPAAVAAAIQLLTAVGGGQIQRGSAVELLVEMGEDRDRAEAIVGEEPPEPEEPAAEAVPPGAPGAPAAPGAPPAEPADPYAPVDGVEWWDRPTKHLEGQHDQTVHGNRYGTHAETGERVLRERKPPKGKPKPKPPEEKPAEPAKPAAKPAEQKPKPKEAVTKDRERASSRTTPAKLKKEDGDLIRSRRMAAPPKVSVPQALEAVKAYTGDESYQAANEAMRDGKDPSEVEPKPQMEHLQTLASQELKSPTIVYRGLSEKATKALLSDNPSEITVQGFASTTLNPDVASKFATTGGAILEIKAKRGLYVRDKSEVEDEYELIQPHGTRYKMVGVREQEQPLTEMERLLGHAQKKPRTIVMLEEI